MYGNALSHKMSVVLQGELKEANLGEEVVVDETGAYYVVTFEKEAGVEPQIGTLKTKACTHPSKPYMIHHSVTSIARR